MNEWNDFHLGGGGEEGVRLSLSSAFYVCMLMLWDSFFWGGYDQIINDGDVFFALCIELGIIATYIHYIHM